MDTLFIKGLSNEVKTELLRQADEHGLPLGIYLKLVLERHASTPLKINLKRINSDKLPAVKLAAGMKGHFE